MVQDKSFDNKFPNMYINERIRQKILFSIFKIFEKNKISYLEAIGFCSGISHSCLEYLRSLNNSEYITQIQNLDKFLTQIKLHTLNNSLSYDYPISDLGAAISLQLKERWHILVKYNFKCKYCGRSPPDVELELDHIIPKSKGGKNDFDNLVPACRECNLAKSDSILKG